MDLNSSHKKAFVSAVLKDVPEVDYAQQLRDNIESIIVRNLPKEIQEMRKNKSLACYLTGRAVYAFDVGVHIVGVLENYGKPSIEKFSTPDEWLELNNIYNLKGKQDFNRKVLERELTASVSGVRTLKQLQKLFPELVKYMPNQIEAVDNLPATNVISKLVSSGWVA